jgi:5-oxoprolinase (ATP-hydrolysing)
VRGSEKVSDKVMSDPNRFRFSIDRGGTFTDIYAEIPGEPGWRVLKLLSENPGIYDSAPLEGIRRILQKHAGSSYSSNKINGEKIEWVRMGTTVATNALLERKGARFGLAITQGFRDLLEIGHQNRPALFDLEIKKLSMLYADVMEVDERVRILSGVSACGMASEMVDNTGVAVLKSLDLVQVETQLRGFLEKGIDCLAVVFMHAHIFSDHEQQVGDLARKMGFRHVSLSSAVMPQIKIVGRGHTSCVDAYLTPHILEYIETFRSGFCGKVPDIYFMQSDGGLASAEVFSGSRAVLSGPAGGVVACAKSAFDPVSAKAVIGFDMGGTSTDISRYDGEYEWRHENETAGIYIQAPQLDIRTVAAGGGSRLFFRNGLLTVGPESSGARPGPVCYGNGGPLSLTDANLILGRLLPKYFPKVFGEKENLPLDLSATQKAFKSLAEEIQREHSMSLEEIALGFVDVANETMARPIREITLQRGYDPKDHVLACFGGAGGQHACALAKLLGIQRIFVHRFAGILSACGIGLADVTAERREPVGATYTPSVWPVLKKKMDALAQKISEDLRDQGQKKIEFQYYLNMRFEGTDTTLMMEANANADFETAFLQRCEKEFGFVLQGKQIIVDDLRVRATGETDPIQAVLLTKNLESAIPAEYSECYFREGYLKTPIYRMADMGAEEVIQGPAIVMQENSVILIEPECTARTSVTGDLWIDVPTSEESFQNDPANPAQLAIFSNRIASIAEQMGNTLQRTAISTNIKERRDFSCAIFDADGDLVVNAPHQPVHLGAMGSAVRKQIEFYRGAICRGDVWASNTPQMGGSHLPDITVITPVWQDDDPVFFVANRGHHADIGGTVPGSMPPFSETLDEEGARIESIKLVENGVFQDARIRAILKDSRRLEDNLSDLRAQVSANNLGSEALCDLATHYGFPVMRGYMKQIQCSAEKAIQTAVRKISTKKRLKKVDVLSAVDYLDDGTPIQLRLTLDQIRGSAIFDFRGTGAELKGNLNAPRAVVDSVILYCLRCLTHEDIPLNQGCFASVEIIIEEGSLLSPSPLAAVAGGNVMTSQRIVDVVFKALELCAASQGCMNNLAFGNEQFGYYETIGGGSGAGPHWHGFSGVHTHMTNTRITDPEIFESRYPVLLREFSLRKQSGGAGRFHGGDGLVREIEFLKPLTVSILSERRNHAPYGLHGGEPGAKGKNEWIKVDRSRENLGGKNQFNAEVGDRIRIMTPGGGGYGRSED